MLFMMRHDASGYPKSITGRQQYQISLNPLVSNNPAVKVY